MADEGVPAAARAAGDENIFLIGLMGAGKTSVGKLLARRLGKTFYDCDHELEDITGVRIPVIFEIEGEAGFRLREKKMIADLVQRRNIVLATGGGAIVSEQNRTALRDNGIVIYLRASPHDLWQRTRHDRNRPLLQIEDPLAKLTELFAERDPLYAEVATVIVDTGSQSLGSLTHRLEQKLSELRAARGAADATPQDRQCAP